EMQQSGRDAGNEYVGYLRQAPSAAIAAFLGSGPRDGGFLAIGTVPCGNAMSPPQLPRDAPVVYVLHPLQIDGPVILGSEADVALGGGARCRRSHAHAAARRLLLHCHEPLQRETRRNRGAAAVALADGVCRVLDARQEPALLEIV